MKHFPTFKTKFTQDALVHTVARESWCVLPSQQCRWINSTVHNLRELILLPNLFGFCCPRRPRHPHASRATRSPANPSYVSHSEDGYQLHRRDAHATLRAERGRGQRRGLDRRLRRVCGGPPCGTSRVRYMQSVRVSSLRTQDDAMLFITVCSASPADVPRVLQVVEQVEHLRHIRGT